MTRDEISQQITALDAERDMLLIRFGEAGGRLAILREWQATLPEDVPPDAPGAEMPARPDSALNDSAAADS